tara:strand:- start:434 stop:1444 length:1011 start_codon:yes stop_codon:yes gene_type:complete
MLNIQKNNYSRSSLDIDTSAMRSLEKLDYKRPWLDLFFLYFQTIVVVYLSVKLTLYSYYFYPLVIFFIAGRQGAFLQLIHEASHNLISNNKRLNHFFGQWLTSFLIGVNFQGYKSGHLQHHTHTATEKEPKSDADKYAIVDFKDPKIYFLFLKDLSGISALRIFFNYGNDLKVKKESNLISKIFNLSKISFVQIIILALFNFDILFYILFWIYPAVGAHMFLMRIRGIAEHGLGKQLGLKIKNTSEGAYYTRSFLTSANKYTFSPFTLIEKLLIGSFYVNYHHEHHLNAKIPYYNLKKFHVMVKDNISQHLKAPIYERGYFSAAFRTVLVPKEELL